MSLKRLAIDALAVLLASTVAAPNAKADQSADATKLKCVEDNTTAQDARRAGDFGAARRHLQSCAQAACPAIVRADCAARLIELDNARASVVFNVTDAGGRPIAEGQVSVDGELATSALGQPLKIDPGRHVFKIETPGHPAVSRDLLLSDNGVPRYERIVIPEPTVAPAAEDDVLLAPPAALVLSKTLAPPSGRRHKIGLVLIGLGAVGVGTAALFGWAAASDWNDAKSACGGNPARCSNAHAGQVDQASAVRDATVSTVAAVGSAALLAAGAIALFAEGSPKNQTTLAPSVGAHDIVLSAVTSW